MSGRDHGWPEGYGWPGYLSGQIALAKAKRAEEILLNEIAPLEDKDEQQRALAAWMKVSCGSTQAITRKLKELGVLSWSLPSYVLDPPWRESDEEVDGFVVRSVCADGL